MKGDYFLRLRAWNALLVSARYYYQQLWRPGYVDTETVVETALFFYIIIYGGW